MLFLFQSCLISSNVEFVRGKQKRFCRRRNRQFWAICGIFVTVRPACLSLTQSCLPKRLVVAQAMLLLCDCPLHAGIVTLLKLTFPFSTRAFHFGLHRHILSSYNMSVGRHQIFSFLALLERAVFVWSSHLILVVKRRI